jgi:hypothetical protein
VGGGGVGGGGGGGVGDGGGGRLEVSHSFHTVLMPSGVLS